MSLFSYSQDYKMLSEVFLRTPDRYCPIIQFTETVMRKNSELAPEERELIAAYVSTFNGCAFCFGAHKATAEAYGVDADILTSLQDNPDSPAVSEMLPPS